MTPGNDGLWFSRNTKKENWVKRAMWMNGIGLTFISSKQCPKIIEIYESFIFYKSNNASQPTAKESPELPVYKDF